jgi:hypothetical protein
LVAAAAHTVIIQATATEMEVDLADASARPTEKDDDDAVVIKAKAIEKRLNRVAHAMLASVEPHSTFTNTMTAIDIANLSFSSAFGGASFVVTRVLSSVTSDNPSYAFRRPCLS